MTFPGDCTVRFRYVLFLVDYCIALLIPLFLLFVKLFQSGLLLGFVFISKSACSFIAHVHNPGLGSGLSQQDQEDTVVMEEKVSSKEIRRRQSHEDNSRRNN